MGPGCSDSFRGLTQQQDTEALHDTGGWKSVELCEWGTNQESQLKGVAGLWYRAHVSETRCFREELHGPKKGCRFSFVIASGDRIHPAWWIGPA